MAAQDTVTFLPLVGLAQADVAVGAAGRAWAWASPDCPVFNPTVQLAVAHAVPDETSRLRAAEQSGSDEKSAAPHAQALLVAVGRSP